MTLLQKHCKNRVFFSNIDKIKYYLLYSYVYEHNRKYDAKSFINKTNKL